MITGAIFDMDGVLLDSMPMWEKIAAIYLREQGREPKPGLTEVLFTKTLLEAAEYMQVIYDIPKSPEEIVAGIVATVRYYYEKKIPMKAGALDFVKGLKEAGIRITIATSSDRSLAEAGLLRLGLLEYIEEIFTCADAGEGKEKGPVVYLNAWKYMETDMDKTWVFEDVLHGIRTANKAGFPTVGVYDASSEANQELIQKEAAVYLKDLTDFDTFFQLAMAR